MMEGIRCQSCNNCWISTNGSFGIITTQLIQCALSCNLDKNLGKLESESDHVVERLICYAKSIKRAIQKQSGATYVNVHIICDTHCVRRFAVCIARLLIYDRPKFS